MIEIPQQYYDRDIIQKAAIFSVQTPRIVEIISILIDNAEKEREEERALDGATESLIARLRPLLYGLSLQSQDLSSLIYKAGYKEQIDAAEKCSEAMP